MNRPGHTLVELVAATTLFMMLGLVVLGISARVLTAVAAETVDTELYEIAEVTERILQRELGGPATLEAVYTPEGRLVPVADFPGGEIQLIYYGYHELDKDSFDRVTTLKAIHHKQTTGKLLLRDELKDMTTLPGSLGGYDIATKIKAIRLYPSNGKGIQIHLELSHQDRTLQREIYIYPGIR